MASGGRGPIVGLQLALSLIIVALGYWLYVSITEPYEAIRRQEALRDVTRARMAQVRTAMIRYEAVNDRYTTSLDSLVMFVKSDSLLRVGADSLFGAGFVADSLIHSPRTGNRFTLSVNDTSRVQTYLLLDPDSGDRIGTELPDVTLLNAASWE